MKKGTKIFLSIFLIIAIILGCLIWWWCGFFYSTSSYFYNQVSQNEYNPLPTIASLPEHKSVKYKFFKDYMGVFESEAYTMIVKYDEDTYNAQKNIIYEPFEKTEEIFIGYQPEELTRNTSPIELDGFSFEMFSKDFPKIIYFVGTNDDTSEIAYILYEDHDLDEISEPYSVFIDKCCGW